MKKKLMPQTVAPVQRETSATVSRDSSAIIASIAQSLGMKMSMDPCAGDDAE